MYYSRRRHRAPILLSAHGHLQVDSFVSLDDKDNERIKSVTCHPLLWNHHPDWGHKMRASCPLYSVVTSMFTTCDIQSIYRQHKDILVKKSAIYLCKDCFTMLVYGPLKSPEILTRNGNKSLRQGLLVLVDEWNKMQLSRWCIHAFKICRS